MQTVVHCTSQSVAQLAVRQDAETLTGDHRLETQTVPLWSTLGAQPEQIPSTDPARTIMGITVPLWFNLEAKPEQTPTEDPLVQIMQLTVPWWLRSLGVKPEQTLTGGHPLGIVEVTMLPRFPLVEGPGRTNLHLVGRHDGLKRNGHR